MLQLPIEIQRHILSFRQRWRDDYDRVLHQLKFRFVMFEFIHRVYDYEGCEDPSFVKDLLDWIYNHSIDGFEYNISWIRTQIIGKKLIEIRFE